MQGSGDAVCLLCMLGAVHCHRHLSLLLLLTQVTEGNPCIEYIEHIVFPWFSKFELTHMQDT
jgi:hypothetical protein